MEAYWAHNPEVRGSNPGRAMFFRMDLQKIDAFPDHLISIKEKLSSRAISNLHDYQNLKKIPPSPCTLDLMGGQPKMIKNIPLIE